MSSDLNNGTGGPLFVTSATPPKIDPSAAPLHPPLFTSGSGEEKKDMVKDTAEAIAPASNSASASSGLGKSDHTNNYFRGKQILPII